MSYNVCVKQNDHIFQLLYVDIVNNSKGIV